MVDLPHSISLNQFPTWATRQFLNNMGLGKRDLFSMHFALEMRLFRFGLPPFSMGLVQQFRT